MLVEPNSAPFGDTAHKRNDRFGALVALPISRWGSRSLSRLTIKHGGFKSTALPMDAHLALIYRAITTTSAIAVASSGAAINDGFCYFCILQTDISSSAYLETFADLRRGVPKRPYITKSIQMAESDGPLKVEDQIRRVPILRLLDCKKRRYIEPLYTRQSSYKLRGLNHQYHI